MSALIFFAAILAILVFVIRLIIRVIKHRPIASDARILVLILVAYSLLWGTFYFLSSYKAVSPGTDICFDDWCATVTKIERPQLLAADGRAVSPHGQFIILTIRMSNQARGIAQKPSEPRVHIIDNMGNYWSFSEEGQQAFEKQAGKQISIGSKLELHQILETQLVFDIPKDAKNLKALIEEGPFITKLLFPENKQVFILSQP
jgi:hypothetical protein